MKPPAWLRELHRRWQSARGGRTTQATRAYSRAWEDLLDAAGVMAAEERNVAEQEASALEQQGRLKLARHRYRSYIIEKVSVPLEAEPWLAGLFGARTGREQFGQSMDMLHRHRELEHPRLPGTWRQFVERIHSAWVEGRTARPFSWRHPDLCKSLLKSLYALTSREWPSGTQLRNADQILGWETKTMEQHRAGLEAGLTLLFGEPFTLESLGLVCTRSHIMVQGPLTLHFPDGPAHTISGLHGPTTISHADLERATHATTTAARLLSIENEKSTFADVCAVNRGGDTLLLATSYPTAATLRLLELLPTALPHHHFGDTDASGYAILRALRQQSPRQVWPFLMEWMDDETSRPLTEHDLRLLPSLLESDLLQDCRFHLKSMKTAGRKGRFEQERFGAPTLRCWPFWECKADPMSRLRQ